MSVGIVYIFIILNINVHAIKSFFFFELLLFFNGLPKYSLVEMIFFFFRKIQVGGRLGWLTFDFVRNHPEENLMRFFDHKPFSDAML